MIFHRCAKQFRYDVYRAAYAFAWLFASQLSALGQVTTSPDHTDRADAKLAEVVRLGEAIVQNTTSHSLSKNHVGNALNCTSCHLDNGRHPTAGTFLGTATAYPAWSPREKRVITLEDRVLNCFMRSCNGIRPPLGSEVSVAVTTYITSLSQGQSMQMNPMRPVGPRSSQATGCQSRSS